VKIAGVTKNLLDRSFFLIGGLATTEGILYRLEAASAISLLGVTLRESLQERILFLVIWSQMAPGQWSGWGIQKDCPTSKFPAPS
jgi:hypothetical protein